MTVQGLPSFRYHATDGVTTDWQAPICFDDGDLEVFVDAGATRIDLVLGVDYTVIDAGLPTVKVRTTTPQPTDRLIWIYRKLPRTQLSVYTETGRFPAKTVESDFDRLVLMVLELEERINRSVRYREGDQGNLSGLLPALADLKGKLLGFTGDAGALQAIDPATIIPAIEAPFTDETHVVYRSPVGAALNSGLTPDKPVLTLSGAITVAQALIAESGGRAVIVSDGADTVAQDLTIPDKVSIVAPALRIVGNHFIGDECLVDIYEAITADSTDNIFKKTGAGNSYVRLRQMDLRGPAADLTAVIGLFCDTGGAIWADVDRAIVSASSTLMRDGTSDGAYGQIFYRGHEIILAGNNAEAIRARANSTLLTVDVQRIRKSGSPTGTIAVAVNSTNTPTVRLRAQQIQADTAWESLGTASVFVDCPSITGTKTSKATADSSTADIAARQAMASTSGAVTITPSAAPSAPRLFDFSETLTDDVTVQVAAGSLADGEIIFIQRSGINGAYSFTATGLTYGGDISLLQGQSLALVADAGSWRAIGLLPLVAGGGGSDATVAWEEVVVSSSTTLTVADHSLVHAVDGQIRYRVVKVERGSDAEAVLTMQNNPGALAAWRVSRRDAFASAIDVARDTAGSINGGTKITIGPSVGDTVDVWLDKQETGPDVPTYRARGDIAGSTTLLGALNANGYPIIDAAIRLSQNAQTGTSYTLALADAAKVVTMNNGSANALTIPTNASVAFAVGTVIPLAQIGAGVTTIEAATGVTLNGVSAGSGAVEKRYGGVSLVKIAADTWLAIGAIGTVA